MVTMRAALHDGKDKINVTDIPRPVVGPGDVLVRVVASGICGSDLLISADKTEPDTVPAGHEVAGEIVEVGEGVDPARLGERVAIETLGHGRACATCWYCRTGQYVQCENKFPYFSGAFAQYIMRRAIGCFPIPDELSWEAGALVEPLAVSVHGMRRGQLSGEETVVVLGAGNIGLTAVAAARAMGAGKIFATARHAHQADMARSLGADDVLPTDGPDLWDAVADVTDGRGADMTIESVGGTGDATLKQALEVTRKQGRIVVLGNFRRPITLGYMEPLIREQSLIFSICYGVLNGHHDYEIAIDMMASGRVSLTQMVTHRFPLEQIQKGFDTAYDKSSGSIKVQLKM